MQKPKLYSKCTKCKRWLKTGKKVPGKLVKAKSAYPYCMPCWQEVMREARAKRL